MNGDQWTREQMDTAIREFEQGAAGLLSPRMCAICLRAIERDLYPEHMQHAHGYETVEIRSAEGVQ